MARAKQKGRAARELAVVKNLEWLRENSPEKFAEAMRLLARLVAETERESQVQ